MSYFQYLSKKNMKQLLLFAAFCSLILNSFAQCPTGDLLLTTQVEIDNFAANYPGCTILTHELRVDGDTSTITNLNGLSSITQAQDLYVNNTQINDFTGLDNLTVVENLSIWFNENIVDLTGLTSLESAGGLILFVNSNLTSLAGTDSLQSVGNLNIFQNPNLNDLSDLSFLESIEYLSLVSNGLTSLVGLENLQTVLNDINIADEPLNNLNDFSNLQTIGGSLYISNVPGIQDLSVFSNIVSLENLYVIGCTGLSDLSGLENVQNVSGTLRIGFNSIITNLNEFSGVTLVGDLDIYENSNLQSLAGLENLQAIGGRLFIDSNPALNSIEAIAAVSPTEIDEVVIINNGILSVCDVELICTIITDPNVQKGIANNSAGCNSIAEVEAACLLSVSDYDLNSSVSVYPNPVSEILTLSISDSLIFEKVTVYSILGEVLLSSSEKNINLSQLSEAVYFVEVLTNEGSTTKKILKK
jgi:hypothetical protein